MARSATGVSERGRVSLMRTIDGRVAAQDEVERYRRAAEETLDQLQWCIEYLHRIGKSRIADVIAKNHRLIRTRMRDQGVTRR